MSVLTATGLGFLRNDAILLPVILVAVAIAMWGFWRSRRVHGSPVPLLLAFFGAIALIGGVVLLHGLVAKTSIGGGAILLLVATIWNARLPQACDVPIPLTRSRD